MVAGRKGKLPGTLAVGHGGDVGRERWRELVPGRSRFVAEAVEGPENHPGAEEDAKEGDEPLAQQGKAASGRALQKREQQKHGRKQDAGELSHQSKPGGEACDKQPL